MTTSVKSREAVNVRDKKDAETDIIIIEEGVEKYIKRELKIDG